MNPYTNFNQSSSCNSSCGCMRNYHMSNQVMHCMPCSAFNCCEISSEIVPSLIYVPVIQFGLSTPISNSQEISHRVVEFPNLNQFCLCNDADVYQKPENCMPKAIFNECHESKLSACSVPLSPCIDFNQTISNQMFCTKKEINIKHLKDFRYETRVETNEFGKHFTVYICKEGGCNKEFYRTNNLLDHVRMHAGIRPYNCQYCHKEFTQKSNMKKHLKMHLLPNLEQRKRYQCNQCGACYTERYNFMISKGSNYIQEAIHDIYEKR